MPSPKTGDVHVDMPLSNVSIAFAQKAESFIADKVFANIPSEKKSNLYWNYPRDFWYRDEAKKRAACSESVGGGFGLNTDRYDACVYAYHFDICDQTEANQDAAINLSRDASEFVTHKLMLKRDKVWTDTYFKTGVWDNETDVDGTGDRWDEATGTPIKDLRAGMCDIMESTGFMPNTLVLDQKTWNALQDSPDFLNGDAYAQA